MRVLQRRFVSYFKGESLLTTNMTASSHYFLLTTLTSWKISLMSRTVVECTLQNPDWSLLTKKPEEVIFWVHHIFYNILAVDCQ